MRHGKALVYILCGIAVYVFVIGLQILHGAAFGKLLLFLFGHLAGVVAAAQVVVMAVADEGEHHGIEAPVFAAVGKRPQILRDHLAVAVEVVEPGLVVIPFEARHIFEEVRVFKPVQVAVRLAAAVKAAVVGVEIVGGVARRLHDMRQGKGKVVLQKPLAVGARRDDGVAQLRRVAAQDGQRLGMVGLIAGVVLAHAPAVFRHRVEGGGVVFVDAVPLARFDDDEHHVFAAVPARHVAVCGQGAVPFPFFKIIVQLGELLVALFAGDLVSAAPQPVEKVFAVEAEKAEFFEGFGGEELRFVEVHVVFVLIQRILYVGTAEGEQRGAVQPEAGAGGDDHRECQEQRRLPFEAGDRLHLLLQKDAAREHAAVEQQGEDDQPQRAEQHARVEHVARLADDVEHGKAEHHVAHIQQDGVYHAQHRL